MYMFQPSLLSDLDSLTEPSLDSLPGGANVCTREEPSGASAAPVSTSLEDELMLLRLLELQGSGRGGASLVDVQSTIMRGSCGEDSPQLGRSVSTTSTIASATTASSFSVPELPTEPTRPPRPSTNPIVTADSIISTLQMEIATSGLTADAILAATRHLETVVRPSAGKLGLLTVLRVLNFSFQVQPNGLALHHDQAWVGLEAESLLVLEIQEVLVLLVSLESHLGRCFSQTPVRAGILLGEKMQDLY